MSSRACFSSSLFASDNNASAPTMASNADSNIAMGTAVERGILVSEIPYDTDDVEKLKDDLEKYFGKRKTGGGDVERVICPFGRSLGTAVVVFEEQRGMLLLYRGILYQ